MKVKLFYSYSHKDKSYRDKLETHLSTLKDNNLIDEWHDKEILAGEDWGDEIESNMNSADIILLLFSPDFIKSQSCKNEVNKALELKKQKGTIFIPIILRECSWKDIGDIAHILVLPEDGMAVSKWDDKDGAWNSVYEGIKKQVEKIRREIMPRLKDDFKTELLKNPIMDSTLDKLFIYPDILEVDKSEQKLERNEIDSEKLSDIVNFEHKYILIEGEEQSGKTSLCRTLYLHYIDTGFHPILINGKDIIGKADIKSIVNKLYGKQYDSTKEYWLLDKTKRILIVDDINERNADNDNYANFLQSIKDNFEYAIIFIDELFNLSEKSTEHDYFYPFNDYTIKSLGHKKRDELIKKCISNDENTEFSLDNTGQVARLDKDTGHINTIISSNIFPSYPVFIVSTFNIIETVAQQDMRETSYGHCYHAMITTQLYRANVKPNHMDEYFNFLTELSYFMFNKDKKNISQDELNQFRAEHIENYIFDANIINNITNTNILIKRNGVYSFQYIYIYYYFVAKYISEHIDDADIKQKVENLLSSIYKKDSSNIIIFITHHTKNSKLLDDILLNAMVTFENFSEATLAKEELRFISDAIGKLQQPTLPPDNHNVEQSRNETLQERDQIQPDIDKSDSEADDTEDLLLIEIRKSAKNMEIIGQIMKNQYGTFTRDRLKELFEEGQNVGLRLLKSFIKLMDYADDFENFIKSRLIQVEKEKGRELSRENAKKISQQLVTGFSYSVIFGWLHKIVDSLGYNKLIEIADDVNNKTDTVASKLINFSIHAWYKKELNINKIKQLYNEFKNDKNYIAVHILKDIVIQHIYMHKIDYQKKQKIDSLLGLSLQKQISVQQKINK